MHKSYLIVVFVGIFAINGCSLINPEEPIPGYIHIPKIDFATDNPNQGTSQQNITDAWVFLNDELLGSFPVPGTFPILAQGSNRISIRPGVILNGIGATRIANPFFKPFDTTINFIGKRLDTIQITSGYNTNTNFRWSDDFEQQSTDLIRAQNSDTTFTINSQSGIAFEGTGVLQIIVDQLRPFARLESATRFVRPNSFAAAFWEMHYKNEVPFNIGIVVYSQGGFRFAYPLVRLNPSNEWKKVYLNISDGIFELNPGDSFALYITTETDFGPQSGTVLLDNLKLMF